MLDNLLTNKLGLLNRGLVNWPKCLIFDFFGVHSCSEVICTVLICNGWVRFSIQI